MCALWSYGSQRRPRALSCLGCSLSILQKHPPPVSLYVLTAERIEEEIINATPLPSLRLVDLPPRRAHFWRKLQNYHSVDLIFPSFPAFHRSSIGETLRPWPPHVSYSCGTYPAPSRTARPLLSFLFRLVVVRRGLQEGHGSVVGAPIKSSGFTLIERTEKNIENFDEARGKWRLLRRSSWISRSRWMSLCSTRW